MQDIIPLQNAHATQYTVGHLKGGWSIEENITNKVLFTLPSNMSESEVFGLLEAIRKYEIEAFNKGISLGKEKTVSVYDKKIKQLSAIIEYTKDENERLANALDNVYNKE